MEQYKTDAEIYAVLEREIIDLTIRPGSPLSENPLCARFGAPRTLIRVVLQKLQENGLVKIVPYKGTTVTRLNRRIVDELPEVVYISFDIDGLTIEHCPHTGTPVPGGITFEQVVYLMECVADSGRRIAGFDLVEVVPCPEDKIDAVVGARVLYKLCGLALRTSSAGRG